MLPVVLAHAAGSRAGAGGIDPRAIALGLAIAAVAVVAGPLLTGTVPVGRKRAALGHVAGLGAAALATAAGLARPAAVVAIGVAVLGTLLPRGGVAPKIVLLVLITGGGQGAVDLWDRGLGVTHVVAAALWIAVVLEVVLAWASGAGRRLAQRAATPALILLVVVAATGSINAAEHLGDARLALGTWWGRLLAVKVAVVAVAAGVGALVRRPWTPRAETVGLGGAAIAGLFLAAAGGPLSGAAPTGPLFAAVDGATVVVTPMAPGENLVLIEGAAVPVRIDGRDVAAGPVELEEGRHTITVGSASFPVTIRPNDADDVVRATWPEGSDDPDCIDHLAGAAAAVAARTGDGRPTRLEVTRSGTTCGVEGASRTEGASPVVAALAALADRGNSAAAKVITDGSARASALVAQLPGAEVLDPAAVAAEWTTTEVVDFGPAIVATDPATAGAVARQISLATNATVPIILAPWLLDADLLAGLADDGIPVLVAADRDPTSPIAVEYRVAATSMPSGPPPTAAGLQGYLDALGSIGGSVLDPDPGLFSLSRVAILPPSLDSHPSESGWAPGVALVRVA